MVPHTEAVRGQWGLDFSRLIVNHGSFGATPLSVLAVQDRWRRRMEAAPTLFMDDELPAATRQAASAVAAALGAQGQDLALVDNATAAINAVVASIPFAPGDEILVHTHTYGAVLKTLRHIAGKTGAVIVMAELPFPDPTEAALVEAFASRLGPKTKLLVIDHITSPSAYILPLQPVIAACKAAGVAVLVDGAHGPGQVAIDLSTLGADYYVGNGHKWWMGAKGAGFLWAARDRQEGLHPTIISHGYGGGFTKEFDWTGTRDWSAALTLPDAIAFHASLGGPALIAANHDLAVASAEKLAARFGTGLAGSPDLHGAMTLVELPYAGPATEERALALRELFKQQGCDVPTMALAGRFWIRLSAQAYNLPSDFDRLGDLVEMLTQNRRG